MKVIAKPKRTKHTEAVKQLNKKSFLRLHRDINGIATIAIPAFTHPAPIFASWLSFSPKPAF